MKAVVVGQEDGWIWQMRQNSVAQFLQLLKHWLCNMQSGNVIEKNWALFIDQWCLQVFQFSLHLIDLLSILLRCNDFAGIQKTVVEQMGSRPSNSDHDFFLFFMQVWLCEVLWSYSVQPLRCLSLVVIWNLLFLACQNQTRNGSFLLCTIKEDDTSKQWWFFDFQFMRNPLIKLLHLSNLLQMPNDCRMVNIVFVSYFSYSCKRISFDDSLSWSLSTSDGWRLCQPLLISKVLVSFAKLLEPSLHYCMFISNSWAKCIVDVLCCCCYFMTHFELEK